MRNRIRQDGWVSGWAYPFVDDEPTAEPINITPQYSLPAPPKPGVSSTARRVARRYGGLALIFALLGILASGFFIAAACFGLAALREHYRITEKLL